MKQLFTILLILFSFYAMAQVLPMPTGSVEIDAPVTLGMKFKPKANGQVAGVMYYRNFPGTVTGHLWTSTGTLLSSTTFSDNSAGWKSASFATPVNVVAGTDYIVSYFNAAGQYFSAINFFPKSFPNYEASASVYNYGSTVSFPTLSYQGSNYFVEPIFKVVVAPPVVQPCPLPGTIIVRDTIRQYIDTCSIDYSKLTDVQFVVVLPDEGGTVRLPDSTTVYQAIYGAAQPHITMKDTAPRMYRFTRTYVVNGKSQSVRFTLYKSGAWIRELKNAAGIYEPWPYAPY